MKFSYCFYCILTCGRYWTRTSGLYDVRVKVSFFKQLYHVIYFIDFNLITYNFVLMQYCDGNTSWESSTVTITYVNGNPLLIKVTYKNKGKSWLSIKYLILKILRILIYTLMLYTKKDQREMLEMIR